WAGLYREVRELLHSGTTVRADLTDPSVLLHGVVSPDRSEALFAWVRTATGAPQRSGRVIFPGLDPARRYSVRVREEVGEARRLQNADPAWLTESSEVSGELLAVVGVPLPTLAATNALVLHLTAAP